MCLLVGPIVSSNNNSQLACHSEPICIIAKLSLDKDNSQYKIYYVQECTRAKSGVSGTDVT